jgi:hypothetical protein
MIHATCYALRIPIQLDGNEPEELEQFGDAFEHSEREIAQSIVREKRGSKE